MAFYLITIVNCGVPIKWMAFYW